MTIINNCCEFERNSWLISNTRKFLKEVNSLYKENGYYMIIDFKHS